MTGALAGHFTCGALTSSPAAHIASMRRWRDEPRPTGGAAPFAGRRPRTAIDPCTNQRTMLQLMVRQSTVIDAGWRRDATRDGRSA